MSNPYASLKKSRKTPLNLPGTLGSRQVPFKNQPRYSVDENKLLEEISGNMASSRQREFNSKDAIVPKGASLPQISRSPRVTNTNTASVPTDNDLLTAMMSRLTQSESRLQYQTKEISEKDKKIRILEDKVKILQKSRDEGDPNRVLDLERKCLHLQKEVCDMETFLADYGLVWVGDTDRKDVYNDEGLSLDEEDPELAEMWRPETSVHGNSSSFVMDYDVVLKNIEDLNQLAGEGIAKIQHTTDGARLKIPDSIQLTLYANGILMFSGPFRPFMDPTTQECMQDLLDGFFPSELQSRYPDGVPFQVTDKRTVVFKDKKADFFKGTGQTLGGETKPSRLVPSNLDHSSQYPENQEQLEESELPGPKMTIEQFLNRLPQSVVKEGKIIDIRNNIGTTLQGESPKNNNDVTLIETPSVQDMKARLERGQSANAKNITTLRIKSEKGDHTFIMKMKFEDTIGDVYQQLNTLRSSTSHSYEVASSFPSTVYTDMKATLEECNLVPNAVLHLKAKQN